MFQIILMFIIMTLSLVLIFYNLGCFIADDMRLVNGLFGLLGIGLLAFQLWVMVNPYDNNLSIYGRKEIINISDTTRIQGRGNMFYVSISENNKYIFYTIENGFYVENTISTRNAFIKEFDGNPYILEYRNGYKNKVLAWFNKGMNYNGAIRYELYIPKGSITRDFNIDLKK